MKPKCPACHATLALLQETKETKQGLIVKLLEREKVYYCPGCDDSGTLSELSQTARGLRRC